MQDISKVLKQTMLDRKCNATYAFLYMRNNTSEKHENSVIAKRKDSE